MFTQISSSATRQRRLLAGSLVAHGLALAWLLHSPEPLKLQPNSVAIGRNGTSVTRLYWDSRSVDNSKHSSPDRATERYKRERLGANKLTWQPPAQIATSRQTPLRTPSQDDAKTQTLSALGHGAQAGSPYGGAIGGPFYGDEIRPAYPSLMSDPNFYPWQLPASPGNEVIELTIDERGDIVNKKVLASLGSEIDDKCLAALEGWHFHPATRNGVPIPSKYDYVVPLKARG